MVTHSSNFAWRIPWTEEPGGLLLMGSQESDTAEQTHKRHHSQQCDRFSIDFCQLKKNVQHESYMLRAK